MRPSGPPSRRGRGQAICGSLQDHQAARFVVDGDRRFVVHSNITRPRDSGRLAVKKIGAHPMRSFGLYVSA